MLTPFGIKLRTYRIERGVRLKDLADALNVSSSYLSALEMGKKNIPEVVLISIARYMSLNNHQLCELRELAQQSKKINFVNTSSLDPQGTCMVGAFARHFNELNLEEKEKIRDIFKRFQNK